MAYHLNLIINFTTNPVDLTKGQPHSGSFAEGFWLSGSGAGFPAVAQFLAGLRRACLPGAAYVSGFRLQNYTITGNKLLPGGSSSSQFLFNGNPAFTLNLPQDALEINGTAAGTPNSNRFPMRCLPDEVVKNGEYQPNTNFNLLLNNYLAGILAVPGMFSKAIGFIGRDHTQPSARVTAYNGTIVTLQANVGGVAGTDFLRFTRVYDQNGNPVKGSFLITNIAGNVYTIQGGPSQTVAHPSGSARIDMIAFQTYGQLLAGRAVVKKVGKPTSSYRAKRSKQRI